jgi:hypothetical protein
LLARQLSPAYGYTSRAHLGIAHSCRGAELTTRDRDAEAAS